MIIMMSEGCGSIPVHFAMLLAFLLAVYSKKIECDVEAESREYSCKQPPSIVAHDGDYYVVCLVGCGKRFVDKCHCEWL